MLKTRRGFTLVELLVVIAIIGILAGMVMGVMSRANAGALKTSDLNNLKQIGTAANLYAQANHQMFPHYGDGTNGMAGTNDFDGSLICLSLMVRQKIIDNADTFISPAGTMIPAEIPDFDDKSALAEFVLEDYNTSYLWSKRLIKIGTRSTRPVSCTAYISSESESDELEGGEAVDPYQGFDDGINVLYVDGTVKWVPLTNQGELEKVADKVNVSQGLQDYIDE